MKRIRWCGIALVLVVTVAWGVTPVATPGKVMPAPPRPFNPKQSSGMPDVLPAPPRQQLKASAAANAAVSPEIIKMNEAFKRVRADRSVPEGYMRIEASTEWRGQSAGWQRAQASRMVKVIKSRQPKANIQGVVIVDKDTGAVVRQIKASDLPN